MVPELQLDGLILMPIIVAVIQGLKAAGVPSKYAPWLNAILSVAFYALAVFITAHPEYLTAANVVLNGLVIFLGAAGFYDLAQPTIKRITNPT